VTSAYPGSRGKKELGDGGRKDGVKPVFMCWKVAQGSSTGELNGGFLYGFRETKRREKRNLGRETQLGKERN